MKKILITVFVLGFSSLSLSAGMWDSITDAYNKIKDDVKDAGNSVDYFKKCDDKKNIEYFQKENTHLREYLYVSSVRGTNVRERPDSKSKAICALPLNMPVRLMKIENKDTVNNAESYWIKVLIPYYLQEEYDCGEYGYVFGNYLSHDVLELKELSSNWNSDSLKGLLESGSWIGKKYSILFLHDGTYVKLENDKKSTGKWIAKDGHVVSIDDKDNDVQIKDACTISIAGEVYEKKFSYNLVLEAENCAAIYYADKNEMNGLEYLSILNGKTPDGAKIKELNITADKFLNNDVLEEEYRKIKGEKRNYHFETIKINDSDKKLGTNDYSTLSENDIDNDNEIEFIKYKNNAGKLSFIVQKKDYYYDLKYKDNINYANIEGMQSAVAYALESPVPYIILEKKYDNKIAVELYTIKGNELKFICKQEQVKSAYKIYVQFYFDSDNFYINFYDADKDNVLSFAAGYVYQQNVNDIYTFSLQKKLKK